MFLCDHKFMFIVYTSQLPSNNAFRPLWQRAYCMFCLNAVPVSSFEICNWTWNEIKYEINDGLVIKGFTWHMQEIKHVTGGAVIEKEPATGWWNYCDRPKTDYFPITACPRECYSFYPKGTCPKFFVKEQAILFWSILELMNLKEITFIKLSKLLLKWFKWETKKI